MSNLNPCSFCGEREHLHVHAGYYGDNDQFIWDDNFNIVRGPTGEPVCRNDDGIECLVCNASAPLTMWQADDAARRNMRDRTLEAWAEYDDDGIWHAPELAA